MYTCVKFAASSLFTRENFASLASQNVPSENQIGVDLQADLNLCWTQMSNGTFPDIVSNACIYIFSGCTGKI